MKLTNVHRAYLFAILGTGSFMFACVADERWVVIFNAVNAGASFIGVWESLRLHHFKMMLQEISDGVLDRLKKDVAALERESVLLSSIQSQHAASLRARMNAIKNTDSIGPRDE